MSQLIDDDIFLKNISQYNQLKQKKPSSTFKQNNKQLFNYHHELNNKIFNVFAIKQIFYQSKQCFKIIIPFTKKLFGIIDIWYTMIIDSYGICLMQQAIISKDQFPFLLKSYKKKILALKLLNSIKIQDQKYVKILLKNQNFFTIQFPKMQLNKNFINSIKLSVKKNQKQFEFRYYVQKRIKFILDDSKSTLKYIFQTLTDIKLKQQTSKKQTIQISTISNVSISNNKDQNYIQRLQEQLYRFLHRAPIQLRFDYTEGSAVYEKVMDITITQQKQIQQRIKYINSSNVFKLSCLQIFLQNHCLYTDKYFNSFHLNVKQKQIIKLLLAIPEIIPQKNNNTFHYGIILQNKYLYNSIILQYPGKGINFLAESGFGKLQYGCFNFWYTMNTTKVQGNNNQQDNQYEIMNNNQDNRIRNKYLVVKSPKVQRNNINDDCKQNQKFIAKHKHQLNIIKKFKGFSCIFFPRYYQIQCFYKQQPEGFIKINDSTYKNSLFIQMTNFANQPGYNLRDFINDNQLILTIKKVIFIMGQVAQGLRFLHMHKIVHMDLKPENILIVKNYLIKIIDFGQSYHPQVKYENTRPAYTYPYGCPQITEEKRGKFSQKSDVFSFGIILFQLLYGKDLITTNPNILLQRFINKDYLKNIYITPEQNENFGQKIVFPMLNLLILKCIEPVISDRPSMTWISVLLKYFMQMLF